MNTDKYLSTPKKPRETDGKPSIRERIEIFRDTGEGYDSIVNDLSWRAYQFPKKKNRMSEDDCSDFFIFLFDKIKSLPASFIDKGVPFDNYFGSILKWKLKTYIEKKLNSAETWENINSSPFDEEFFASVNESTEVDKPDLKTLRRIFTMDESGNLLVECEKKIVLFLGLKHAQHLSCDHIRKLSRLTGYAEQWIIETTEKLRGVMKKRNDRSMLIRDRRNTVYRRIEMLRRRLAGEYEPYKRAQLRAKLKGLRTRHSKLNDTLSRISTTISNKTIANMTGFARGTIDSAMRRLKLRLMKLDSSPGMQVPALLTGQKEPIAENNYQGS